jgi:dTDP-4-amino-4,6-dideoxygalactose transaminase
MVDISVALQQKKRAIILHEIEKLKRDVEFFQQRKYKKELEGARRWLAIYEKNLQQVESILRSKLGGMPTGKLISPVYMFYVEAEEYNSSVLARSREQLNRYLNAQGVEYYKVRKYKIRTLKGLMNTLLEEYDEKWPIQDLDIRREIMQTITKVRRGQLVTIGETYG